MYDVYYTTGGGPWVNAGTDSWVNLWMELIAPKLDVKPILLIHRNKLEHYKNYQFPIETYWHGDSTEKFEELCKDARRINILHGHYTPMKVLIDNKEKIFSNVIHNSVNHIIKSQLGSDLPFAYHPYLDSSWEKQINEWSTHSIWIGLYEILIKNLNITNFYEFKHNKELSNSTKVGFASRSEGRKNPHYLDGLESFVFTNSAEFNKIWKEEVGIDTSKIKIYHYVSRFKDYFYNMDWGISHSAFTDEPFGYSIFEAVDRGKLPILHKTWCKDFEYPYRASSKNEFNDIYKVVCNQSYEEKLHWFNKLKNYMKENYTDKELWVNKFLNIYNS